LEYFNISPAYLSYLKIWIKNTSILTDKQKENLIKALLNIKVH